MSMSIRPGYGSVPEEPICRAEEPPVDFLSSGDEDPFLEVAPTPGSTANPSESCAEIVNAYEDAIECADTCGKVSMAACIVIDAASAAAVSTSSLGPIGSIAVGIAVDLGCNLAAQEICERVCEPELPNDPARAM